jgi:hypothetical protein
MELVVIIVQIVSCGMAELVRAWNKGGLSITAGYLLSACCAMRQQVCKWLLAKISQVWARRRLVRQADMMLFRLGGVRL